MTTKELKLRNYILTDEFKCLKSVKAYSKYEAIKKSLMTNVIDIRECYNIKFGVWVGYFNEMAFHSDSLHECEVFKMSLPNRYKTMATIKKI